MNTTYLIVDDVAMMRAVIKDMLVRFCKAEKGNLFDANSGADAIAKYGKLEPDIVFLDINMPDTDGITAVKKIMKQDPNAKIIMCTAASDREIVQECMAAGASGYILKPPDPEKVREAVEKALGEDLSDKPREVNNEKKVQQLEDEMAKMQMQLEEAKRLLEEETKAKAEAAAKDVIE
ncbi:MAG: response regulator [Clostridiales bacterium]|jgi:two-component system chemotaxis response regulator CheY|nr:response regulator [Clostridiales bacterium]